MVLKNIFIFVFLVALTKSYDSVGSQCPKINPLPDFNLTEYTKQRWYIQKQQVTSYLPVELNYCVTAQYKLSNKLIPFYFGKVLSVFNYANFNEVNGPSTNKNNFTLCARMKNESDPARLLVAPCFLPNFFAGDYWVIAAGPSSNNYSWAIISAGQPTIRYPDGCTTRNDTSNGSGLWFFTRNQTVSQDIIDEMSNKVKSLGYTTSQLNDVKQEGCKYL